MPPKSAYGTFRSGPKSCFSLGSRNALRILSISGLGLAAASLGLAAAGFDEVSMEPHEKFVCTFGAATRLVSIYSQTASSGQHERGPCRVDYTKDGKTNTLWSSTSDQTYCTKKALALVTHLIQGNFACKPQSVDLPNEPDPPVGRR